MINSFRIKQLIKKCKRRGDGNCPCTNECQAIEAIKKQIGDLEIQRLNIGRDIKSYESQLEKMETPPATLKDGWKFDIPSGYNLVVYFDFGEANWGYECPDTGDWIDGEGWPWNEDFVYWDDWEREGFTIT